MSKTKSLQRTKKLGNIELSMLCHQMALVFKSGVNPLEGLPLIAEDITDPDIKSSLESISKKMVDGMTMFQAFSEEGIFPSYMLRMIAIGEMTGMLDTVMDNLSVYYETEADINRRIKSAVTYPVILAVLMLGVIALLILKIIPMFGEILAELGGQVPKEAEILFSFALNMKTAMIWLVGIVLLLGLTFIIFIKTPKGRFAFDRFKVTNPMTGPLYKKIIASRLGYGLSLTVKSGMNAMDGFNSVKGVISNDYVNENIKQASHKISEGASFSDVIKETGLFPELYIRMVRTGEKAGNLDNMMEKLSRVYAQEAELAIKRLSGAIEPVMVTILSLILGVVILSVLLPLIGMMSSIG